MARVPETRFTIANMMILTAGVALALGVILTPGLVPALGGFGIALVVLGLTSYLISRRVLDLTAGIECPNCGKRGLERRAIQSFGERFFLCPQCGIRCRRGLTGETYWKDASGPEFDVVYQKPPTEDPWNAPPGLEEDDLIYSKTHVNLVYNKRRRRPEDPNGPGLE